MAEFDAIYVEGDDTETISTITIDIVTPDPVVIRGAGSTTL